MDNASRPSGIIDRRLSVAMIGAAVVAVSIGAFLLGLYLDLDGLEIAGVALLAIAVVFAVVRLQRSDAGRSRAERTLKRGEVQLRRAEQLAKLAHWVWHPERPGEGWDRGIAEYSDAIADIFGVAPADMQMSNRAFIDRFVHPDDRGKVAEAFSHIANAGPRAFALEYRIQRPDGTIRTIYDVAKAVFEPDGTYSHTIGTVQDITDRKEIEENLRRSERSFRRVIDSNMVGVVFWGPDGTIHDANDAYLGIIGYTREELTAGKVNWRQITPPEYASVDDAANRRLQQQGVTGAYEKEYIRKDGSRVPVLIGGTALESDPAQGVSFVLDLTQQRKIEEQLRQGQKLQALGQLTGGVAHDFNNLLMIIMGNAEMLAAKLEGNPRLLEMAELINNSAKRAAELTGRLLAFARRQPLRPAAVDVNRLVAGMDGMLRRTLGESVRIELVQGAGLWQAMIDSTALETAILNLAINARDAMPNGGCLTVATANTHIDEAYARMRSEVRPGQYVAISVTDNGIGMSPEVAKQAFEPFFTTKDVGKGSGLGLSMVYGFIKQSRGHVSLYSEPDKGTTVRMYLPRVVGGTEQPAVGNDGMVPLPQGTERVLLVEDDDLVRSYSESQLRQLGYAVVAVNDGQSALEALKRDAFDLLFTDVVLPGGLNGRQLADQARKLHPQLKVLYTSGYTADAIVHNGHLGPGVNLISKPYRQQDLAFKLRRVLSE
jgi:PAS domain S-box-containing protein